LRGAAQVVAGLALVLVGVQLVRGRRFGWLERVGHAVWRRLGPLARGALGARGFGAAFRTGLVWGWLPCGMAYTMLLLAAANLDPLRGAATMAAFGIGTLPALLAAGHGAQRLAALSRRPGLRAAGGALVCAVGLLSLAAPWLPLGHTVFGALLDCR
jgi:sulfite exporter TauE/SafE